MVKLMGLVQGAEADSFGAAAGAEELCPYLDLGFACLLLRENRSQATVGGS